MIAFVTFVKDSILKSSGINIFIIVDICLKKLMVTLLPISQTENLTGDESGIVEKTFWKMFFATRDIKDVDEFLITYFMMATNLTYYFEDSEDFRKKIRVMIVGQFEQDLYNKSFSKQLESGDDEFILQQRSK